MQAEEDIYQDLVLCNVDRQPKRVLPKIPPSLAQFHFNPDVGLGDSRFFSLVIFASLSFPEQNLIHFYFPAAGDTSGET